MLKRFLAYMLVVIAIVAIILMTRGPREIASEEFTPLLDPHEVIWLDQWPQKIPGEPRPFKKVVFGPNYTEADAKLLDVITELHDLSHRAVCNGNYPNLAHLHEAKSLSHRVDSLIAKSRFGPLITDLRQVMEWMTDPAPSTHSWTMAHRIVHDIDFQLLDRVDASGDKASVDYWGESQTVEMWRAGTRHWP